MATYKTPDVYVEEISLFPPSVAEVETAIPAFIGYTQKALKNGVEDLTLVPTKITSMAEYEESFGYGPPVNISKVNLNSSNSITSVDLNLTFYMYDAVRMFYNNGGGKCYIISIGVYPESIDPDNDLIDFEEGLEQLKKKDEPTLIVFPDAVLLKDNLYTLQALALKQANELQDRFVVCDLLEGEDTEGPIEWSDGIDAFRDNIGINYLKYGAAYTPWLKTNLSKTVKYTDLREQIYKGDGDDFIKLDSLTTDQQVIKTIKNLEDAISDNNIINGSAAGISAFLGSYETLQVGYNYYVGEFKATANTELARLTATPPANDGDLLLQDVVDKFKALLTYVYDAADQLIDEWAKSGSTLKVNEDAITTLDTIKSFVTTSLQSEFGTLNKYLKEPGAYFGSNDLNGIYLVEDNYIWSDEVWGSTFQSGSIELDNTIYTQGDTNKQYIKNMLTAEAYVLAVFNKLNTAVYAISEAAKTYIANFETALIAQFPLYKNIVSRVKAELAKMPPSGAVVGVYAAIDSSRGVWKANVVGLTATIDSKEQEDLNVDVIAGKSINAIRAFTGKGILIWGARTLAGNDNEWRYVPVRRFFNMVEESVKKSTYWAVFEPNDANTWIKVKSMIENYLTLKWKDGALAGSKPDEAFYVKVGLGVTMTAQDILEGRMNVEIGMAVVRPAEFIILKFSHKMQES